MNAQSIERVRALWDKEECNRILFENANEHYNVEME